MRPLGHSGWMDHGKPDLPGASVLGCSDEHTTFEPRPPVGERVRLVPTHVDPTVAYHERAYLVREEEVLDVLEIDLRCWRAV
jgi:D-serine deaminase-like pyridoxal phosphate-dependent protein